MNSENSNPIHQGFGVAPSPFNPVKLQAGILLVFGLCLLVFFAVLHFKQGLQLGLLAIYAGLASSWIMLRAKRVLRQQQSQRVCHVKK